jgi:hypothetical protein
MTFRLWPLWVKGGLIATFPRASALPLNNGRNFANRSQAMPQQAQGHIEK